MPRVGVPEIMVILAIAMFWLVPIAAGLWAILTLHRIRIAQEAMGSHLQTIVSLMQSNVNVRT